MESQEELIASALQAQQQITRGLRADADPIWLQLDLPLSQIKALFALAETPLSISQLGEQIGIGRPACTHLVERLVQTGLVQRGEDPLDRRRTIVQLTSMADDLVVQLRQGGRRRMHGWLSSLDEDDLTSLVQGLRALARMAAAGQTSQPHTSTEE